MTTHDAPSCARCGRPVGVGKWWQKVPRATGGDASSFGALCDPCHEIWLAERCRCHYRTACPAGVVVVPIGNGAEPISHSAPQLTDREKSTSNQS